MLHLTNTTVPRWNKLVSWYCMFRVKDSSIQISVEAMPPTWALCRCPDYAGVPGELDYLWRLHYGTKVCLFGHLFKKFYKAKTKSRHFWYGVRLLPDVPYQCPKFSNIRPDNPWSEKRNNLFHISHAVIWRRRGRSLLNALFARKCRELFNWGNISFLWASV